MWLVNASPAELRKIPPIMERVENVQKLRSGSKRAATRKLAATPTLFGEIRQPKSGQYLMIPSVSSERRRYIPVGFLNAETIASDASLIVPNASLYHFGVLTSNVHMAWMRAVAGRLKSDYRYSASIVYNNFPWPNPTEAQRQRLSRQRKPSLTLAPSSRIAALPTSTMRQLCLQSCAKLIRRMTAL